MAIAVGLGRVHHPTVSGLLGALVQNDAVAPLTRLAVAAVLACIGHGTAVLPIVRALALDER